MAKIAETMRSSEFWELVANRYAKKPDTLRISVGCHELPNAKEPIGLENMPQFAASYSVDLGQVRRWAAEEEKRRKRTAFKMWLPALLLWLVVVLPAIVIYALRHISRP